jgi:hypothetical protein
MSQPLANPSKKPPKEKKADDRHWYQKKRWMLPIGFIVLISIMSAITGSGDSPPAEEPTQSASVSVAEPAETNEVQVATVDLTVPDLIGQNTSDALDELEALGFTEGAAQDASYEERNVLLRSNWFVCEMRPNPGTPLDSNKSVILLSVKNTETCPTATSSDANSETAPEEPAPAVTDSRYGNLTSAQVAMTSLIVDYQSKYDAAENDLQQGNVRLERDEAICSAIGGSKVSGWSGVIDDLGATSEGYAYLKIAFGKNITLETWNNEFSDIFDDTLVERGTALYDILLNLKKGQVVTFSGEFIEGDGACLDTKNLSEYYAVNSPEFVFKFSSVKP